MQVRLVWNQLVVSDYRSMGGDIERDWMDLNEVFASFELMLVRMSELAAQGVDSFSVDIL